MVGICPGGYCPGGICPRTNIAQQVLDAASPRKAKKVAAQLKSPEQSTNLVKCTAIKVSLMAFILKVKWNKYAKFRQTLPEQSVRPLHVIIGV